MSSSLLSHSFDAMVDRYSESCEENQDRFTPDFPSKKTAGIYKHLLTSQVWLDIQHVVVSSAQERSNEASPNLEISGRLGLPSEENKGGGSPHYSQSNQ